MNNNRVFFKTFGCRTNQFDTQIMISKLQDFELTSEDKADTIVINSCTVTNGADSSVRNYINSVKKNNPKAKIILAGCGAFSKGEELLAKKSVFGVMGHSKKESINSILQHNQPFYELGDINHIDDSIVAEFIGKSRAFIKIQEGCNFRCSYCIIPFVRGDARSHAEATILEQVRILASNGFGEFILTGTNVGSYGQDTNTSIAQLIKKIAIIRGVRRIRIGSLEPIQIDSEFKELLSEPFMARHLHIALQHTSDRMLEVMNRRNHFMSDMELLHEIASKGYAIGTDFIVGHPHETQELWDEAIRRVQELPLTHIHAFRYSKRDNTPSASMKESVNGDIAKARHQELVALIKHKNFIFRQEHNQNLEVLIESAKEGIYSGLDQYFNRIEIQSNEEISSTWRFFDSVVVEDERNVAKLKS
jgi:MiaB-like tRNA modifying enzyme